MIGAIIGIVLLAAFGYFIYTKVTADKEDKPSKGGGNGRGGDKV